jgi:hypothetical protein
MELRDAIAREAYRAFGPDIDDPWDLAIERRAKLGLSTTLSQNQERCLELADAILAIPEIAEGLEYRAELGPINHELRAIIQETVDNPVRDD